MPYVTFPAVGGSAGAGRDGGPERPRIVIVDDYPPLFGSAEHPALRPLAAVAEIVVHSSRWKDRDEFLSRVSGADIAVNVRAYSKFDAESLEQAPGLRLINVVGTGVDNVDLEAATRRGVTVCNTPGVASEAVAELALGLLFAAARGIARSDRELRQGVWAHRFNVELRGKTLGLLGLGAIGRRMAMLGSGIGMRVIAWNRTHGRAAELGLPVEEVEFDEVFRSSDAVSLHLRSTPATARLVAARELALMKPTAILVNTARAALVDLPALAEALRAGRLAGAGLDVHQVEPLPLEQNLFRDIDNVVLTPHVGSLSPDADERSIAATVANVLAYLEGRPRNVLNPAATAC
jgi:phosphoglycerate dehydrogenase-like enzyme